MASNNIILINGTEYIQTAPGVFTSKPPVKAAEPIKAAEPVQATVNKAEPVKGEPVKAKRVEPVTVEAATAAPTKPVLGFKHSVEEVITKVSHVEISISEELFDYVKNDHAQSWKSSQGYSIRMGPSFGDQFDHRNFTLYCSPNFRGKRVSLQKAVPSCMKTAKTSDVESLKEALTELANEFKNKPLAKSVTLFEDMECL